MLNTKYDPIICACDDVVVCVQKKEATTTKRPIFLKTGLWKLKLSYGI